MTALLAQFAERLMRCPAAPYFEDIVAREVIRICDESRLNYKIDPFGNFIISVAKKTISAPVVLAAHMDHPGFVVRKKLSSTSVLAEFLGGVGDSYFKSGVKLRLMPGNIPSALGNRTGKRRVFEIIASQEISSTPQFAVWDLPDFESANGRFRGRVCDDLIGCATILAVLASLRKSSAAQNIIGVLSRAEEVGFHGALALAESKGIPRKSLVISLETSRELPPVKMGNGVIVRVGDRASTFSSSATRFLTEVASDLAKRDKNFKFQRALMSGGTCEATAYQEYGYESAAVCVALGNYHNCGEHDTIAPEFVSTNDADSMAQLLAECARKWPRAETFTSRLPKRLAKLSRVANRNLRKRSLQID
jgi:endoglucanase